MLKRTPAPPSNKDNFKAGVCTMYNGEDFHVEVFSGASSHADQKIKSETYLYQIKGYVCAVWDACSVSCAVYCVRGGLSDPLNNFALRCSSSKLEHEDGRVDDLGEPSMTVLPPNKAYSLTVAEGALCLRVTWPSCD